MGSSCACAVSRKASVDMTRQARANQSTYSISRLNFINILSLCVAAT